MIRDVRWFFAVLVVASVSTSDVWLDPNLPATLTPLNYVLWMHPEFHGSSAVFHGRVDIDVGVLQDTQTIIVHYKAINITSTTLADQLGVGIPVSHRLDTTAAVDYVRGRSRSLKMAPFNRACTTSYWSAI